MLLLSFCWSRLLANGAVFGYYAILCFHMTVPLMAQGHNGRSSGLCPSVGPCCLCENPDQYRSDSYTAIQPLNFFLFCLGCSALKGTLSSGEVLLSFFSDCAFSVSWLYASFVPQLVHGAFSEDSTAPSWEALC